MVFQEIQPETQATESKSFAQSSFVSPEDNKVLIASMKGNNDTIQANGFPATRIDGVLDIADDEDRLAAYRDTQTDSAPKVLSKEGKESLRDLLERLNHEEFPVREQASRDLVKAGSKFFDALVEAKKSHPEVEVRGRAGAALRAIINDRPAALNRMGEMQADGLSEINRTGRLSKETREKYESFIKTADVLKLSPAEAEARKDFARLKFEDQPATERAKTREQLSLVAMRVSPSSQARMDYASLLIAGGDKTAAVKVLTEAVTKDPSLARVAESDTFRKLAVESGASGDKTFLKAVKETDAGLNPAKDWTSPKTKIVQEIGALQEQTSRFGMTKQLEKQWNKLVADLDQRSRDEPALQGFLKLHKEFAQQHMVEHYGASGKPEQARRVLDDILRGEPKWEGSAWMTQMLRRQEYAKVDPTGPGRPGGDRR